MSSTRPAPRRSSRIQSPQWRVREPSARPSSSSSGRSTRPSRQTSRGVRRGRNTTACASAASAAAPFSIHGAPSRASAASTTPWRAPHHAQRTSDVSGRRSMTRADSLDESRDVGIGRAHCALKGRRRARDPAGRESARSGRNRRRRASLAPLARTTRARRRARACRAGSANAAARAPRSSVPRVARRSSRPQSRRSAIIFLISAIALPGFRSFGHACVQFRIVWQRYRRNASSS